MNINFNPEGLNWAGLVVCVVLPSVLFGFGLAAWFVRSVGEECVSCGAIGKHHPYCRDCCGMDDMEEAAP